MSIKTSSLTSSTLILSGLLLVAVIYCLKYLKALGSISGGLLILKIFGVFPASLRPSQIDKGNSVSIDKRIYINQTVQAMSPQLTTCDRKQN